MTILVSNDDGYDSPLLGYLLEELKGLGEITVVVPSEEQSWTGKSISRFGEMEESLVNISGHDVKCFNGRPADCVNYGIYHLYKTKPDLVISGINIGFNCGVSYILSSGTVGACLEANIAGVPALSLSRRMSPQAYQLWAKERRISDEDQIVIRQEVKKIMNELRERLFSRKDFLSEAVTWQVEMPQDLADNWKIESAVLGHSFYGSLFEKGKDNLFRHCLKRHDVDTRANADINIIARGNVSLAKLDIKQIGQQPVDI